MTFVKIGLWRSGKPFAVSLALQPPTLPPSAVASSEAGRPAPPPCPPPPPPIPSEGRDHLRSHGSRYRSRDCRRSRDRSLLSSDRSWSRERSWRPRRSHRDRVEAVFASRDRGNSGSKVEPAHAVAGGSAPLPTPSLQDLARLFFSLSGPFVQWDAVGASLFSAAGVTGAGALPGLAAPVTSSALPCVCVCECTCFRCGVFRWCCLCDWFVRST